MTHKAISVEVQNTTDIEGIELFNNTVGHDRPPPSDITISDNDWTSEHTAKILGKSVRTIRRLLLEGTLKGYKVPGKRREEWRIKPVTLPDIGSVTAPIHNGQSAMIADNDRLWKLLQEKDAKIEALTMRAGYLQAQMEAKEDQIKLLTDSQHNQKWWQRLRKLFAHPA